MANEFIIEEYTEAGINRAGGIIPVANADNLITVQYVDVGSQSASFDEKTKYIIVSATTTLQYAIGDDSVSATANTSPALRIVAGAMRDFHISTDRKSTRLNSSHSQQSRMPSSA